VYRVFVSYATADLEWATYLRKLLKSAQAEVFVAAYDGQPGEKISDDISRQIKSCDLFLLLWSSRSRASAYVQSEIFLAKAERKRILPLMMEHGLRLPDMLSDLRYLPLDQNPESALAWLQEHVTTSAKSKATGELIGIGLMAFIGWVLASGKK
jgi:hypothetical protein